MYNYNYEKNKVVNKLKNEILGLTKLIEDLNTLKKFNFDKWDKKVINIRLEKALNDNNLNSYISVKYDSLYDYHIKLFLKDRYNEETKQYIDFYDSISISLGYYTHINDAGKELNKRLLANETKENLEKTIKKLEAEKKCLEEELENMDTIIEEIREIEESIKKWRSDKTSFLLEEFKNLRNFY